jgi:hypothetical protein
MRTMSAGKSVASHFSKHVRPKAPTPAPTPEGEMN